MTETELINRSSWLRPRTCTYLGKDVAQGHKGALLLLQAVRPSLGWDSKALHLAHQVFHVCWGQAWGDQAQSPARQEPGCTAATHGADGA